jgi:hypothetical protein
MLAELQRRMRVWITAPEGVRAQGDDFGAWLREDARLPAVDRLEIYANAFFFRLHDALLEDHGALASGLGEALFHDLVTAYLLVHPPRHPSLAHAGDALPDYLADAPSAEPFRRACPWAPDLARLEDARLAAFHAADAQPLPRSVLEELPAEAWESLRLRFVPAFRLLALDWPVHALLRAHDAGEPLPEIAPAEVGLAVWRFEERVHYRSVAADEAAALEGAASGASFGAICERVAERTGEAEAPAQAAGWLSRWQAEGLLRLER